MFSDKERRMLLRNPAVQECTERSITYTLEFKKRAVELYANGMGSNEIWRQAGIDISNWRRDYTKGCVKRWKKIVRKSGQEGLRERRGGARGRTAKGLTDADRIKRLELQVKYLQAERDFLVNLRAKRAESNSGREKNSH
jgi:transposase-like protein